MHDLTVYVKEGLPYAWDLPPENSYVFDWLYFTQCLTSFFSRDHLLHLCVRFLILFHLAKIRFSRSTHLLMFLSLQTLISIIRTGFPILVELIYLVNSIVICISQMTLLRWLTFLLPDCDSHSPALLDLYFSSDTSICSTIAFPSLGNSDHVVVVSVSIDVPSNSQQDATFYHIAYHYWDGLRDHLRDVPWEDIFKLSASVAASAFCEWVQVGIDEYIPHRKYQVKPHSSPWFSAACALAIVYRNHFFCLYQKDKSSDSKVKFRKAGNCCKKVLEAAKFAYANKTKESITSQKRGSWDFW